MSLHEALRNGEAAEHPGFASSREPWNRKNKFTDYTYRPKGQL
jgi:hypothetical protein